MKQFFLFILILGFASKSIGQIDSNIKFKPILPKNTNVKPKKETLPPPSQLPQLDLPKILAPNVFKETNIYGTKPKTNNSFEIGSFENQFSMIKKNRFEHQLGDVFQSKMTKDLEKTMIREELKEDKSVLDRKDRYLGEYKIKAEFLIVKYRDYIYIDGDLINIYVNGKVFRSELFLDSELAKLHIPLVPGFNDIEFIVASTGTSGGNTAELHVLDNNNNVIKTEYWDNLALGVKIKMIVIKE